jgi:hypothetical protein
VWISSTLAIKVLNLLVCRPKFQVRQQSLSFCLNELVRLTIIVFLDIIHRPVFYLKPQHFADWILSPSSGGTYSSWTQSIELVPLYGHLHQDRSQSKLLYDGRLTANQFLAASPLRLTTSNFIFQLNT